MAEVLLDGVYKIYPGNVTAVRHVNLTIRDGEFLVLVGPSGCGKSTTLRMIAGLEEISRGTIAIGNRVVNDLPPKSRDIAMVFQNYALYPHMTVRDNLGFGLKLRRTPKAEIEERVNNAARILDIGELMERRPKALSGGQRQRVAMGRAIVRNPKVFLFDEPLSNLDAKMRVEMRKEIMHLHKTVRTTMVYVTHDQVEAMTLGDRIVVMNKGVIQQVDEPMTVYRYPANTFVASFIGTPPMNLFEGHIQAKDNRLFFHGLEDQLVVPLDDRFKAACEGRIGKKVIFGIRPEDLRLLDPAEAENAPCILASVDLAETLGNEVLAYMKVGKHTFRVRLEAHQRPELDVEFRIEPNITHAHIFDGETGQNLTAPPEILRTSQETYAADAALV